jgi:hypothetical protein
MLLDVRYRLLSDEHGAGCWREVLRSDIKKTGNRETTVRSGFFRIKNIPNGGNS